MVKLSHLFPSRYNMLVAFQIVLVARVLFICSCTGPWRMQKLPGYVSFNLSRLFYSAFHLVANTTLAAVSIYLNSLYCDLSVLHSKIPSNIVSGFIGNFFRIFWISA